MVTRVLVKLMRMTIIAMVIMVTMMIKMVITKIVIKVMETGDDNGSGDNFDECNITTDEIY